MHSLRLQPPAHCCASSRVQRVGSPSHSHVCPGGSFARRSFRVVPAAQADQPSSTSSDLPLRKIVLLRHAESETRRDVRDHDRQLSEEGRAQAMRIAAKLQEVGWVPDLVLASNAKRTKQTLDEMTSVMVKLGDVDAHYYGSLYTVAALDGQTRQHLQECLLEVVDDARNYCVMLVGHNKGWEEAASSFAGHTVKLKAASAALLQVAAQSWDDVLKEDTRWQLVGVLMP